MKDPVFKIVDWPIGQGDTDGGQYPNIHLFEDIESAVECIHELLDDYAASRASSVAIALGADERADLSEYIRAADRLGQWRVQPGTEAWTFSTHLEAVSLQQVSRAEANGEGSVIRSPP